jgi:hypothetical protein
MLRDCESVVLRYGHDLSKVRLNNSMLGVARFNNENNFKWPLKCLLIHWNPEISKRNFVDSKSIVDGKY